MDFRRPFRAITPTLDGDVLAVLAGADAEFTGRQVHGLVKHGSERGVRNALDRLAQQGVALSRRAGGAKHYRLNPEHLATPWVKGLAGMRVQLLERLTETVERWEEQPALAVLFGSVARDEATESSDLDILIVRPVRDGIDSTVWEAQLGELERAATAWSGNDARVLEYGVHELGNGSKAETVIREAVQGGVVVSGSLPELRRSLPGSAES